MTNVNKWEGSIIKGEMTNTTQFLIKNEKHFIDEDTPFNSIIIKQINWYGNVIFIWYLPFQPMSFFKKPCFVSTIF